MLERDEYHDFIYFGKPDGILISCVQIIFSYKMTVFQTDCYGTFKTYLIADRETNFPVLITEPDNDKVPVSPALLTSHPLPPNSILKLIWS